MNLWLKSYVGAAPLPDGVYIEAGQRSFVLKGANLFPGVARLLKAFDGTQALSDIERALPEKARPLLQTLVSELRRHDMVRTMDCPIDEILPAWQRNLYRSTLNLYQNETPSATACFSTLRTAALTVVGHGRSFVSLVCALTKAGVRELHLVPEASAEEAAHVEVIKRNIEKHRILDPELCVRWHAAADFHGIPLPGTAQVLYISDSISLENDTSLFGLIVRNAVPGTMIGGVVGGRGLVGPRTAAEPWFPANIWAHLQAIDAPAPFSVTTCAVIGALMALQIIKQPLYRLNAELAQWPEQNLFQISATGEVTTHPVMQPAQKPLQAESRNPQQQRMSREEWFVAERIRLQSRLPLGFDSLTGVLAWVDDNGSAFPLPHRSLRVRPVPPATGAFLLTEWGLTQQDVGLRALYRAIVAVVELTPTLAAQLDNECVVDSTPEHWRDKALARAIVHSPLFSRACTHRVDPESIPDPGFRMLARLLRLYREQLPRIVVAWVPGLPAFLAEVGVDNHSTRAIGDTLLAAVSEAAGLLVSTFQRPSQQESLAHIADRSARPPLPALDACAIDATPVPSDAPSREPARTLADFGFREIEQLIVVDMFRGAGLKIGSLSVVQELE